MYAKVDARFWDDEKVLGFTPDARYLMLYLLTGGHRNMLGCYRLPRAYAREDTGLPAGRFSRAWAEVMASGMVRYDEATQLVLLCNYLRYNPIENPSQAKAALGRLTALPRSPLFAGLEAILREAGKPYLRALADLAATKLPEGDSAPATDALAEGVTDEGEPGTSPATEEQPETADIKAGDSPSGESLTVDIQAPEARMVAPESQAPAVEPTPLLRPVSGTVPGKPAARRREGTKARELPDAPPEGTLRYAEHVYMTPAEYAQLQAQMGEAGARRCVEVLDHYKGASGKRYRSDYHAILHWVVRRVEEERAQEQAAREPRPSGNGFLDIARRMRAEREAAGDAGASENPLMEGVYNF